VSEWITCKVNGNAGWSILVLSMVEIVEVPGHIRATRGLKHRAVDDTLDIRKRSYFRENDVIFGYLCEAFPIIARLLSTKRLVVLLFSTSMGPKNEDALRLSL
jgi:hypothetical protein